MAISQFSTLYKYDAQNIPTLMVLPNRLGVMHKHCCFNDSHWFCFMTRARSTSTSSLNKCIAVAWRNAWWNRFCIFVLSNPVKLSNARRMVINRLHPLVTIPLLFCCEMTFNMPLRRLRFNACTILLLWLLSNVSNTLLYEISFAIVCISTVKGKLYT